MIAVATKPAKYRKRPVVIEAMQYTGFAARDQRSSADEVAQWVSGSSGVTARVAYEKDRELYIHTLEGEMHVSVGDWVIKGIKGEFYLCKPDIFEATYEAVEEAHYG